jgi:hypothetical protein
MGKKHAKATNSEGTWKILVLLTFNTVIHKYRIIAYQTDITVFVCHTEKLGRTSGSGVTSLA